MPRRDSRTGSASASGPRSGSRPRSCTPAGRWACGSSPRTSTSCGATARWSSDPRTPSAGSLMADRFKSVDDVVERLRAVDYLADPNIAGVVYLADRLEKPVLVEGPAGVGKTELAKALSAVTGARLIRLQCYEGLDESKALYEWNYKKQLLRIQADREHETSWADVEADIFSEPFLLTRPLVVMTSNNTRELSEALKRRCLYLHLDYPDLEREKDIVRVRVPDVDDELAEQVARVVRSIRQLELKKAPSISETIDWAKTLLFLGKNEIDPELIGETLHVLLKYQSDIAKARKELQVDGGPLPARTASAGP